MQSLHDTISGLTSSAPTTIDKQILVRRFANDLGWNPSYYLNPSNEKEFVNIHLVVEHGLENTAIISFLKSPFSDLTIEQRRRLLNISYNNMVDWHIHVEQSKITYIYNRYNPIDNVVDEYSFKRDQYEQLRSEAFEKIIGKRPSPNIPTLDDALINTISYWKRSISAELDNSVSNEELSTLFNSIIFIRAIEDNKKWFFPEQFKKRALIETWTDLKDKSSQTIFNIIKKTIITLGSQIPKYLLNINDLKVFDGVSKQSISYLLSDFYDNKHNTFYQYDFSIMSKHALSRIYEKYVAILKVEDSPQLSMFPVLPIEEINKASGTVYTPQYISRFFAKYLKENLPPSEFRKIKVAEPSVGSGIFLRSLLELQCDPRQEDLTNDIIKNCFKSVFALDIDPNACKATELSLALLQLVLTNEFPEKLNVVNSESIEFIQTHKRINETFDVILANPPFISTTGQTENMRSKISDYMNGFGSGRIDSYLAFLKIGLDLLKPGGYGLYVLPHSFLMSSSAATMRKVLIEKCWIRCVADLSAIPVFGDTGIYITLLIFQKKTDHQTFSPKTTIIKCRDMVGKALQEALKKEFKETDFYSVFEVEQETFQETEWHILPLSENRIQSKIKKFPSIDTFLEVRQGFVSGSDAVFILDKHQVPKTEKQIFKPFLPDRKMLRYSLPKEEPEQYFFYPFLNGKKIDAETMKSKFPKTWKYLHDNKKKLVGNKSKDNSEDWWRPHRPRNPDILKTKIITPHLTITPKFSIDLVGNYTVSHSPFLFPKEDTVSGEEILLFFLAVLNSSTCYWYINNHSHKYSRGYTMLEVKTLMKTPVPDPALVPPKIMKKLLDLVSTRLSKSSFDGLKIEREIDIIVASLYDLTQEDQRVLGIE